MKYENDLRERSKVLDSSSDLSQSHKESQSYLISNNLKLIEFYKSVFQGNKRSLQYNFPDTHTSRLNKILKNYRSLEEHNNIEIFFDIYSEKLKTDFLSLGERKNSSIKGLDNEIKERGLALGVGLLFFVFN